MVEEPANVTRYLAGVGEATELPPPLAGARPPVLEEPRAPPAGVR